jgi:hypothetical protein
VARSDYNRPFNPVDALRYNPIDVDGWHFDRTRRAGEFALYDEYDPRRKIELVVSPRPTAPLATRTIARIGSASGSSTSTDEGTYVPGGTNPKPTGQQARPTCRPGTTATTASSATPATTGWSAAPGATTSTAASATTC